MDLNTNFVGTKNRGGRCREHQRIVWVYIATGRINIRIHRDIEGEMWFGVGIIQAFFMEYSLQIQPFYGSCSPFSGNI
jgi:hypothetical protein